VKEFNVTSGKTKRLYCGHCNIEVDMSEKSCTEYTEYFGDEDPQYMEYVELHWILYQCPVCKKPTLVQDHRSSFEQWEDQWPFHSEILYPQKANILKYLPESVAKELSSAINVKARDCNMYAVAVGRTLEQVCRDKQACGKNLFEQLQDLANKGLLPSTLIKASNKLRIVRNLGAHASLGDVNKSDVEILDALLNSILEYLYRAPALIDELKSTIKKSGEK
jgi:hypothetical protein